MNAFTSFIGLLVVTGGMCACGWYVGKRERIIAVPESKPANRKSTFGKLSVAMPIIGVFLPFVIASLNEGNEGFVILAFTLIPLLCFIVGLIFAITALVRREQNQIFPTIGLLIFFAAVFYIVWVVTSGGSIGPTHF